MLTLKFKNYNGDETVVGEFATRQQLNQGVVAWLKQHNITPRGKNNTYITRTFYDDNGRETIDYGSWASFLIVEGAE